MLVNGANRRASRSRRMGSTNDPPTILRGRQGPRSPPSPDPVSTIAQPCGVSQDLVICAASRGLGLSRPRRGTTGATMSATGIDARLHLNVFGLKSYITYN